MGKILEAGDRGLWVTYARGMKVKAVREFIELCYEVREQHIPFAQHSDTDYSMPNLCMVFRKRVMCQWTSRVH